MKCGDVVRVDGWGGVAFWLKAIDEDDNRARVVMVGDDRVYTVDLDDCSVLKDNEYCVECGQIGCGWHQYDGDA